MRFLKLFFGKKWFALGALALMFSLGAGSFASNTPTASAAPGDIPCGGRYLAQPLYHDSELYSLKTFYNTSVYIGANFISDETIQYKIEPNPIANQVKVVLHTPSTMTWWKEIALGSYATGTMLTRDYTQDGKHTATITTTSSSNLCLQLSKAAIFGIHTPVFYTSLYGMQGRIIHIYWVTD